MPSFGTARKYNVYENIVSQTPRSVKGIPAFAAKKAFFPQIRRRKAFFVLFPYSPPKTPFSAIKSF